ALTRIDLQHIASADRDAALIQQAQQQLAAPFDLVQGPLFRATLFRLGDDSHLLLMTMQHIVSDGWSWGVLCRELSAYYEGAIAGTPAILPDLPIQYADYAVWQREYLQGSVRDAQLDYWRQQLADLPVLELPTDHPRPAVISPAGDSLFFQLPADLTAALSAFTQREGVTLFMTGLATLQVLLARYSRQTDLAVGTPIANRTRHETEELIGCFVNTLVLRSRLSLRGSVRDLLQHVRSVALEAYAHQDVPFEEVVDALQPERDLSRTPLFQVMFVLQNAPLAPLTLPDVAIERFQLPSTTSKFDLTLTLEETPDGISGNVEFSTALFERPTIERLVAHFQTLLAGIVSDPDQPIGLLPLLSEAERHHLLVTCQPDAVATPVTQCLHQIFEAQAARTPQFIAVSHDQEHLTYGDLDARANQLARYLQRLGVRAETRVGLYLHRSLDLMVGMLAILKAGAAYVPIDPTYPVERVAFMVADMQAPVIVTHEQLAAKLYAEHADHQATTICLDRDRERIGQESTERVSAPVTPDQLAYIIYTSGSTGRPKGTLISHAMVVRLFSSTQPWFHFDTGDVWTLFHSAAFDFSVWEIWGALLHGGRLVIVPYLTSRDPEAFYDLLRSEQVTVLNQTPSAFRQLIAVDRQRGSTASDLALRYVIFGGEALDLQSLRPWFEHHGDQRPQLVNMYGITETTVHVTYRPLTLADLSDHSRSVIGGPIPDLRLYVCDPFGQLAPTGAPGELYVGGAGVARGYLNRPALTAERFVPDPFAQSPEQAGARLYRSGDLARYLPNGDIEYLGRIDQQVKLRGFRIELGEIEAALKQHPAVREAVVLVRDDRLVAYVVQEQRNKETREQENLEPRTKNQEVEPEIPPRLSPTRRKPAEEWGRGAGGEGLVPNLRQHLGQRLPEYMIPAVFVPLKELPLTTNGKLDRKALPVPDLTSIERQDTLVAPRTPAEEVVAQIWSRLLRIEQISVHDNFFELGGNSLLATQVIVRLHEIFPINVSVRSMFDRPTVAGLVEALVALWGQADALDALDEIATIYQQMESLSEEEVRALLMAQD
ncbi:MAG TPA: amino acid adenylation domain-containing protein, partial [Herpetosiphonaceae bacterium]